MGVEFPVSASALPVCQPARDHGAGAGHRLPRHRRTWSRKRAYLTNGQDGRRHLIQRFGGAQPGMFTSTCCFSDGVYVEQSQWLSRFPLGQGADQPRTHQLAHHRPPGRVAIWNSGAAWNGMLENSYLASDAVDDDPMTPCWGTRSYRIAAVGPQAGRKVFTANSARQW